MANRTPTLRHAAAFVAGAAGLAGLGCVSQQARVASAPPEPAAAEPAPPVAPALSLFAEEDWLPPDELPTDPIPLTSNPNSTNVFRVTFASDGADFDPSASRDGAFLVFASTQHSYSSDIYIKRTGSTVITQLTSDTARDAQPTISPDGEWIAFTSDRDGDWNIYLMPRAGGRPVQLTSDTSPEIHPSWSPDGSKLVFSKLGPTSGKWEMWVTDVSNTSTPHFIGYGLFPEWCPVPGTGESGGDMIVYQRSTERGDRAFAVWTVEFNEDRIGNPSRLIGEPSTAYINPTWSPDGSFVVFASVEDPRSVRMVGATGGRESDLWMMSTDGATLVSLTTGSSTDLLPTWAADGNIYFVSTRTGRDNIWSIDAGEAMMAAGIAPQRPVANAPTGE